MTDYMEQAGNLNIQEADDRYNTCLMRGQYYERAVNDLFKTHYDIDLGIYETMEEQYNIGESKLCIEVKYDRKSWGTGNLYIETQEKTSADKYSFTDSGILRNDNSKFYLIGNKEEFFMIDKNFLNELHTENGFDDLNIKHTETKTSRGFLINIKELKEYIYKNKEEKILHFTPKFAYIYNLTFYTDQDCDFSIPEKEYVLSFISNQIGQTLTEKQQHQAQLDKELEPQQKSHRRGMRM